MVSGQTCEAITGGGLRLLALSDGLLAEPSPRPPGLTSPTCRRARRGDRSVSGWQPPLSAKNAPLSIDLQLRSLRIGHFWSSTGKARSLRWTSNTDRQFLRTLPSV